MAYGEWCHFSRETLLVFHEVFKVARNQELPFLSNVGFLLLRDLTKFESFALQIKAYPSVYLYDREKDSFVEFCSRRHQRTKEMFLAFLQYQDYETYSQHCLTPKF